MKPAIPILMTCLGVLMTVSGRGVSHQFDHDEVKSLRETGRILSMEVVMRHAFSVQPGQLLGAELEGKHGRYLYKITILDAAGQIHALELDATTGALTDMESR